MNSKLERQMKKAHEDFEKSTDGASILRVIREGIEANGSPKRIILYYKTLNRLMEENPPGLEAALTVVKNNVLCLFGVPLMTDSMGMHLDYYGDERAGEGRLLV